MFNSKTAVWIILIFGLNLVSAGSDGKYVATKYGSSGKYRPDNSAKSTAKPNEGTSKYVSDVHKYRYVHVHIPYDGGFGPYDHIDNPYFHDGRPYDPFSDDYPYIHDPRPYDPFRDAYPYDPFKDKYPYDPFKDKYPYNQDDSKGAETKNKDPFDVNVYYIEKPAVLREYGPPLFDPTNDIDRRMKNEKITTKVESVGPSRVAATASVIAARSSGETVQPSNTIKAESKGSQAKVQITANSKILGVAKVLPRRDPERIEKVRQGKSEAKLDISKESSQRISTVKPDLEPPKLR